IKVPLNCPDDTCISKRAKSGHVPFKTPTPGEIAHLVTVIGRQTMQTEIKRWRTSSLPETTHGGKV
ncbi:MAG: hypothetical protein G5700_08405, partial [Serratia symbiotica]|nr:hypothetical protein [Serratia symbiotica]